MERSLLAVLVLAAFGVLGTVMALRPHLANVVHMRCPGRETLLYIRLLGVVCGVFSLAIAILLVLVAE